MYEGAYLGAQLQNIGKQYLADKHQKAVDGIFDQITAWVNEHGGDPTSIDPMLYSSRDGMEALGKWRDNYVRTQEGAQRVEEAWGNLAQRQVENATAITSFLEQNKDNDQLFSEGVAKLGEVTGLPYSLRPSQEQAGRYELLYKGREGDTPNGVTYSKDELLGMLKSNIADSDKLKRYLIGSHIAITKGNNAAMRDRNQWAYDVDRNGVETTLIPQMIFNEQGGLVSGYQVLQRGKPVTFATLQELAQDYGILPGTQGGMSQRVRQAGGGGGVRLGGGGTGGNAASLNGGGQQLKPLNKEQQAAINENFEDTSTRALAEIIQRQNPGFGHNQLVMRVHEMLNSVYEEIARANPSMAKEIAASPNKNAIIAQYIMTRPQAEQEQPGNAARPSSTGSNGGVPPSTGGSADENKPAGDTQPGANEAKPIYAKDIPPGWTGDLYRKAAEVFGDDAVKGMTPDQAASRLAELELNKERDVLNRQVSEALKREVSFKNDGGARALLNRLKKKAGHRERNAMVDKWSMARRDERNKAIYEQFINTFGIQPEDYGIDVSTARFILKSLTGKPQQARFGGR